MLDQFRGSLQAQAIDGAEVVQADVLRLETLPDSWGNYDLIVSASMLEYVPRHEFINALNSLRSLLNKDGGLLLFITRENSIMRLLIGRWWQSNVYTLEELKESFSLAGFSTFSFRKFPFLVSYLNAWGYIVEAKG
jgi:cyclopropane fatty-acyl-phospholipid synthase-like methyltransferase